MLDLQKEGQLAREAVLNAGKKLYEMSRVGEKQVLSEMGRDIKLQADRDAEAMIMDCLKNKSSYPMLAEESGEHGIIEPDSIFWVIDPLDGTWNYKRDVPMCCSSVALMHGETPLIGAIYDFNHDELFWAIQGKGAWDGKGNPLHVSGIENSFQATLATGFPIRTEMSIDGLKWMMEQVSRFKKTRMLGSAALMTAYVACGRIDAYIEHEIMLWDVAAGLALVHEAGGDIQIEQSPVHPWARKIKCASSVALWNP